MALDPREVQQLLTEAAIELPGASDSGMKAVLYGVIKEFFTDSNCWTEDILFRAEAGRVEYPLAPAQDGQVIRLAGTWDHNGIPVPAFMREFSILRLETAPSATQTEDWFSRIVKTITLPTTKENLPIAPDWTLRVHSEHIKDGLLGKMMMHPNKSYSNPTMAAYHLKRFRTGITIARTAAARANIVGGQEWAYPRGWSSGSQRGGVSTAFPGRVF